jgi:hypothetical protein
VSTALLDHRARQRAVVERVEAARGQRTGDLPRVQSCPNWVNSVIEGIATV